MTLKTGLERLGSDRETKSAVRHVLEALVRHAGEWMDAQTLHGYSGVDGPRLDGILSTFAQAFVLDCDGDPPRYRYDPDRLLHIEVDRFLRRAESHTGKVRSGVEAFRRRYPGR